MVDHIDKNDCLVTVNDLRPDLILTQSQCAVCAVTPADLEEALSEWTGTAPVLLSLAPDTLEDVWGDFAKVAEAAGIPERASSVVGDLKERMSGLSRMWGGVVGDHSLTACSRLPP